MSEETKNLKLAFDIFILAMNNFMCIKNNEKIYGDTNKNVTDEFHEARKLYTQALKEFDTKLKLNE